MTTVNFLIHPERTRDSRTDVDILGVRFPFRRENVTKPMTDDRSRLRFDPQRPYVVVTEVKNSQCALNGPWVRPEAGNMRKVLSAVGIVPSNLLETAATALYQNGRFTNDLCVVSLLCIGRFRSPTVEERYPDIPQVTFDEILQFIYERFTDYQVVKAEHDKWDDTGKTLWNCAAFASSVDAFKDAVRVTTTHTEPPSQRQ